ncbi:ISL3 family transposase [Allorhizobium ampelinum S4]|uniref:ISL3 family transposase n=1 Tax=Allorhizobium ampelinum (strain ATCC BAA-846 / DSM 112012 / S4) TaxID=311402 RepID=B9JRL7_ALLAM|nr:ISL3 family transposase [Allorhizobium ampelinum S4]
MALALGNRPAARFADRLGFPVSNDTLLPTIRRYDRSPLPLPSVTGIDDWAWRGGNVGTSQWKDHPHI